MTQFDYTVTFDPGGDLTGPLDITNFVERVELMDIGTGQVRNAKIRLNAQFGRFITNTFGGTLPILDEYQRIRVQITDENSNDLDMTFEVDNLKPMQNTQQGTVLEVEILGLENQLLRVPFAKQFFFESGFIVARDIIDFYNSPQSKGLAQAIVNDNDIAYTGSSGNDLPPTTANDYTFNITELTVYEGLIQVVDRLGSSVAAGGAGDFFDLHFEQELADATFNTISIRIFSSGNPPDQVSIPSIVDSLAVNPGEEEGGIEATKGTVAASWGVDSFGTLPRQNADFAGGLEAWNLFPEHISGVSQFYPEDSIIIDRSSTDAQGDPFHYKANKDTTIDPPTPPTASNADWDQYFFTNFLTLEVGMLISEYSRWTNTRDDEWKNCMANPHDTGYGAGSPTFDGLAAWDSNLVVDDGTFFRTWAHVRAVDVSAIDGEWFYNGISSTTNLYRGFRVLVDTSIGTPVAPLDDPNFANNVVQWDGNAFRIHRNMFDESLCALLARGGGVNGGRVFQLQTGTWTDVSGDSQFNDCFHPISTVSFTQGFNNKDDGMGGNFGQDSAVRFEWRINLSDATTGITSQPRYYRAGAWANFMVPFSPNRFNGIPEVGVLYGDSQAGFPKKEPATIDTNNMHLTSSGTVGFNNIDSEDLGPLDELVFKTKFQYRQNIDGSGALIPRGNFPCRVTCYDTSDNVVVQDFTIGFNNLWEEIRLPLGSFQIYRARLPWSLGDIAQNIFLQQLEILNVFEWKNLKMISIQWSSSYDEQGRYAAWLQRGEIYPSIEEILATPSLGFQSNFNIKWDFDLFEFSKPLLSVSSPITGAGERALFPEFFEEPFIQNKFQNDQANLAKLEISQFRHQQFDVTTTGRTDLRFGDSFFLENSFLVNRADRNETSQGANDGDPNTIKLVCKRILHVIDKPPSGPGGYLTTITGVKRFDS